MLTSVSVLFLFSNHLIIKIMNTDYKVAEVELSYRNRVPSKDRKKVQNFGRCL